MDEASVCTHLKIAMFKWITKTRIETSFGYHHLNSFQLSKYKEHLFLKASEENLE